MRAPRGIGILGGTFDPVHAGHLALAETARKAFGLFSVDFVPAGDPWQKSGVSAGHHRLAMLERAVAGRAGLRVDPIELLREGPTYTIETLAALRGRYGPAMPLVLVMGVDQWNNLSTWRDWRELLSLAHIGVSTREGEVLAPDPQVADWACGRTTTPEALLETAAGRVAFFEMPGHRASSTRVRRIFERCDYPEAMRRMEGWIPYDVAAYIRENHLYAHAGARISL